MGGGGWFAAVPALKSRENMVAGLGAVRAASQGGPGAVTLAVWGHKELRRGPGGAKPQQDLTGGGAARWSGDRPCWVGV